MLVVVSGMTWVYLVAQQQRPRYSRARLAARLAEVRASEEVLAYEAKRLLVPAVLLEEPDPNQRETGYHRGAYLRNQPSILGLSADRPIPNHLIKPAPSTQSLGLHERSHSESYFFGWSSAVADELDSQKLPGYLAKWDSDGREFSVPLPELPSEDRITEIRVNGIGRTCFFRIEEVLHTRARFLRSFRSYTEFVAVFDGASYAERTWKGLGRGPIPSSVDVPRNLWANGITLSSELTASGTALATVLTTLGRDPGCQSRYWPIFETDTGPAWTQLIHDSASLANRCIHQFAALQRLKVGRYPLLFIRPPFKDGGLVAEIQDMHPSGDFGRLTDALCPVGGPEP